MPVGALGSERLASEDPKIVVANHASYADGVLLFSMLPAGFVFVATREFDGTFLGWLLERCVPIRFVERFDPRLALEDARATTELARTKSSLVYFPEGTFQRGAGLLPFHMGAFVAAAQSFPGVLGSRLTGAGFGGCAVIVLPRASRTGLAEHIEREFERRFARRPAVFFFRGHSGPREYAGTPG